MPDTCPKCSVPLDADANFCPSCSAPVNPKCPNCGKSVSAESKFCKYCAHDLTPKTTTTHAKHAPASDSDGHATKPTGTFDSGIDSMLRDRFRNLSDARLLETLEGDLSGHTQKALSIALAEMETRPHIDERRFAIAKVRVKEAIISGDQPRPVRTTPSKVADHDKKLFISPIGAAVAALCFFLPWVEFSLFGVARSGISGASLGGIFWLVFLAALGIIGVFFYFRSVDQLERAKPIIMITSVVALLILIFNFLSFSSGQRTPFGTIRPEDVGLRLQIGALGTFLGLVASAIGTMFLGGDRR